MLSAHPLDTEFCWVFMDILTDIKEAVAKQPEKNRAEVAAKADTTALFFGIILM